ncbi:ribonuclease H-like domain-containing protein [Entophlyctis helioformis]|nr:ribonuclease H-like domain-containing protein [Entophlyctis helioformis]
MIRTCAGQTVRPPALLGSTRLASSPSVAASAAASARAKTKTLAKTAKAATAATAAKRAAPPETSTTLARLARLKNDELKGICKSFGLPSSGVKADLAGRLQSHLHQASTSRPTASLLAVDIGTSNLGFVRLRSSSSSSMHQPPELLEPPTITDWGLLEPDLPKSFDPLAYAQEISRLLDTRLYDDALDTVVIERQSWRPLGVRMSVPHAILRTTAFEAMLTGMLAERGKRQDLRIYSVLPAAVAETLDLAASSGSPSSSTDPGVRPTASVAQRYKAKKNASVAMVRGWLEDGGRVVCPAQLRAMFEGSRKKDDLSDCLLLAMAHLTWQRNARLFAARSPSCA